MLLYFFHLSQNKKIGKLENITLVLVEVRKLWDMSGILTVTDTNLKKKLDTLVQAYQSVKKDSLANRHTKKAEEKRKLWLEQVDSLFDCASPNAEKAIKESRFLDKTDKQADIGFLEDQRSARLQFLRNTDVIFEEKLKEKDEREEAVDKSVEKENKRVSEAAKNDRDQIKLGTRARRP